MKDIFSLILRGGSDIWLKKEKAIYRMLVSGLSFDHEPTFLNLSPLISSDIVVLDHIYPRVYL